MVSPQCLYSYWDLKPLYANVLISLIAPPAFVIGAFCVLLGLYFKGSGTPNAVPQQVCVWVLDARYVVLYKRRDL